MRYPRYAYIPQSVFPNQRDSEKIFVLTRRHFVSFVGYIILFFCLAVIPIIVILLLFGFFTGSLVASSVTVRDVLVIFFCIYYLLVISFLITAWVIYYYDIFVVTDERIIDITQRGLFSREVYELSFEQIEDVTTKTKGFLNTFFEVGDIEIQTAGRQRNFSVKMIPKPIIVAEIIHSLSIQARNDKPIERRSTKMVAIGLIENIPVTKDGEIPPIMNFEGKLNKARYSYQMHKKKPRNLREYFDRWWWRHVRGDEGLFVNYDYLKRYAKQNDDKKGDKSG